MRAPVVLAAQSGLVMTSLELGGSDTFIGLADADADRDPGIPWAVWGRPYNAGRTCRAAKGFIVQESVAGAAVARFAPALEAHRPGDPIRADAELPVGGMKHSRYGCELAGSASWSS